MSSERTINSNSAAQQHRFCYEIPRRLLKVQFSADSRAAPAHRPNADNQAGHPQAKLTLYVQLSMRSNIKFRVRLTIMHAVVPTQRCKFADSATLTVPLRLHDLS